ncbi:MAG: GreA/GreB family elongation factor [Proteobacteria bacterium]|jgi:regulator of nucleoside diphosphate kinase|nr:GreA/GreB family elongation factor [Pseudomonadota bacterium]
MESTRPFERTLTPLDHIRLTRIAPSAPQGMEELLATCDLVAAPAISPDVVTMYSQVLLADTKGGECSKLTLCYPADAEPEKGFISVLSPVGTSLLGLRVGDVARWALPDGTQRAAEIRAVLFQPEASGDYTT